MRVLLRSIGVVAIFATVGVARAQQQSDIPAEATGVLQYLEGTWEFAGRIGGEKFSGTFTARWARGRYALITQDSMNAEEGANPIRSAGVIGWDPVRKQITHFSFASDNSANVNRWNVSATGDWVGQLTGTREGKEFSDEFKITKEPDRFVITSKDAKGIETEVVYEKSSAQKQGPRKKQP